MDWKNWVKERASQCLTLATLKHSFPSFFCPLLPKFGPARGKVIFWGKSGENHAFFARPMEAGKNAGKKWETYIVPFNQEKIAR